MFTNVAVCHFRYPEKLQGKVIKCEVSYEIINVFEARIINISFARNYEYWFRFLQVIED